MEQKGSNNENRMEESDDKPVASEIVKSIGSPNPAVASTEHKAEGSVEEGKEGIPEDEKKYIKEAIKDARMKKCIYKIISSEYEDAVPRGNNYASELYRVKLKMELNSGEIEEKSLIYKTLPRSLERRISMERTGFFLNEKTMYIILLPEMEKIQKKYEKICDPLWPDCYKIKGEGEAFILEDLTTLGYKMANRIKGLDFDHATLVLKSLAKFHALGAVAKDKQNLSELKLNTPFFGTSTEISHAFILKAFSDLATVLEEKWKGEWLNYGKRLRKCIETLSSNLIKCLKPSDDKFNTLVHGDFWLNNMLFKYTYEGKLVNVRFVDFQLSHSNGPGYDLQHFFKSSITHAMYIEFESKFLEMYHEALVDNLKNFGFQGRIPTLEDIFESNEKLRFYGFVVGLAFRPLIMLPENNAPDFDTMAKESMEQKPLTMANFYEYDDDLYVEIIKQNLKEGEERGFL